VSTVYGNAGIEAAKIGGDSPEMDAAANRLAELARTAAMEHNDSGRFAGSIEVANVPGLRGVRDRLTYATDPLAAFKEFGHVIRNEKDGPELGYVPGQHSMQKAWQRMPGVGS
jgi:hypothetical protein